MSYYAGSRRRLERNYVERAVAVFAICFSLYHVWILEKGAFNILAHRSIHLSCIMALCFLTYSATKRKAEALVPKRDLILALLPMAVMVYLVASSERLSMRAVMADPVIPPDLIAGVVYILLLLEATRRSVGMPMVLVALFALSYCLLGPYLPGAWEHPGLSVARIVDSMFLGMQGIWGMPVGVGSTYVFLFVLFGQILLVLGGGRFFSDMAIALAGRATGGPAKIAVIASGLFGSISGSPTANVMTTGTLTIPAMKRAGYSPEFAGGVEAAASTGGSLMPPVMGAVAFLLAEIAGVDYVEVCIAAFIPAVLYYLAIFVMVHLEAVKMRLEPTPSEQALSVGQLLKERGHFLLPLIVIVAVLLMGYSPTVAALRAMAATILVVLIIDIIDKNSLFCGPSI